MPLIYSAANLVEAQLIVDELKAGGMQASVTGSYLSRAIGELPPSEADWNCLGCNEEVGREFGACWNCGKSKPV